MFESLISSAVRASSSVAAQQGLTGLFESVGVDCCCGGKRSLEDVYASKDLDRAAFVVLLKPTSRLPAGAPVDDAKTTTLTAIADHPEQAHYHYLQTELPALVQKAGRVAAKHGRRDLLLLAVAESMREPAATMFLRMENERRILFPLVRDLERDRVKSGHGGSIANSIRQLDHDHDIAGEAMARLRELTEGFAPDVDACNTHRAMLAGNAAFAADLHQHVHRENNVLFPRACALEAQAVA